MDSRGIAVKRVVMVLFWLVLIIAPIAACALAVSFFPPGIEEVPVHWNVKGEIDGYGSPWSMLPVGFIMAGTNLLLALCYCFSDKMFALGLVNGVSTPKGARIVCLVCGVICALVFVGIVIGWAVAALGSL